MTSCHLTRRKPHSYHLWEECFLAQKNHEETRTEKCYAPITVLAATFGKYEDWTLRIKKCEKS